MSFDAIAFLMGLSIAMIYFLISDSLEQRHERKMAELGYVQKKDSRGKFWEKLDKES